MTAIEFFKDVVQKEFRRYALEAGQKNRVARLYTPEIIRRHAMGRNGLCAFCKEDDVLKKDGQWTEDGEWVCCGECKENWETRNKEKEGGDESL